MATNSYPIEIQRFIDFQLACGRFNSEQEIVIAGLEVLIELSDRHVEMTERITRSIAQGEQGQLATVDFEALKHRLAERARDSRPA